MMHIKLSELFLDTRPTQKAIWIHTGVQKCDSTQVSDATQLRPKFMFYPPGLDQIPKVNVEAKLFSTIVIDVPGRLWCYSNEGGTKKIFSSDICYFYGIEKWERMSEEWVFDSGVKNRIILPGIRQSKDPYCLYAVEEYGNLKCSFLFVSRQELYFSRQQHYSSLV